MENQNIVKIINGLKSRVGANQRKEKQSGVENMLKLDLDRINKWTVKFLLQSFLMPYEVRTGFKGINFRKVCDCSDKTNCYDCWLYLKDDPNRLKLNRQQEYRRLSHNILWSIKKGKVKPGTWERIETEQDADRFLRRFTGYY